MTKPYVDVRCDDTPNEWMRMFSSDAKGDELVWHRDRKTREIEVVFGEGWKFQRDNEIPFDINNNSIFKIESMVYHRLIKGRTALIIKIKEDQNEQ